MDDFVLQHKEEQIQHLREALSGTVRERGTLSNDFGRLKWEINTSSILTKLIQEAGRWCESYASDLFVQWEYNIERKLRDGTLETSEYVFAMREGGVDHKKWYEHRAEQSNYYRAVWFLDVTTDNGKIEMVLHK